MQILLVEDDATIARELAWRWQARSWGVQACGTLEAAWRAVQDLQPDVVVLDLHLPDGDGLDWLQRLRTQDRNMPVIALTARDGVSDRVEGLRRGADDYLVKPFAAEELDARIEALERRSAAMRGERMACGRLVLLGGEGRALVDGRPLELHPRELQVLGLLLRRAPRLVARRFLLDALAERNEEMGDTAVDVYVSRLRRKIAGSGAAIVTVRGFGYRIEADGA
ncbi:response regulator transcription factor [Ramlibacter sp. G-1-2-2]|uniref:Response regulator transcription factor n=1 Tax=Ramlibacter agri TaxID=2728837 RepID=A0A848GX17_9BURK|nr:response regulator transcription factor [Ramlibacter agri]NML43206.1 response regulator transcription factor [Ramlibacter agri]